MTVETFFEKFELFADAPDAVERMRELILAMAVQGRLSDRLSSDPPVDNLVQQLRESKKRHSRSRERSEEEAAPIELPYPVPSHWTCLRLCDIGAISGGHTPSKNNHRFWNGDVQWFTSKDIKTDELYESELKITEAAADSPGLQLYPPGCLFMVARSGILKRTFPVAINRVPATANQDLKVLRPFVSGLERYLQIMFRGLTPFILSDLVKTGMTVQSLKYDEFAVQPFPLPPLAEQQRIVAKVDELMGLCDRLEAQQQEREQKHAALSRAARARFAEAPTPANLEYLFHNSYTIDPADLRKSILTMAVQGKLVEHEPTQDDNLPAAIRGRRKALEAAGEIKRTIEWQEFAGLEHSASDLPPHWHRLRLGEIADVVRGGSPRPAGDPAFYDGTIPFLKVGDVTNSPTRYISSYTYTIKEAGLRKTRYIDTRTVLLTNSGATLGIPGICVIPTTFNDGIAAFNCLDPAVYDEYLYLYLLNLSGWFMDVASRGQGQPNLNTDIIKSTWLALPPLAEQKRIVAKVEALMTLVDRLEAQQAQARDLATRLLSAAVAELTSAAT